MRRVPSRRGSAAGPWAAAPLLPKRRSRHPLPTRTLLSSLAPRCSLRSPGSAAPCAPAAPLAALLWLRGCSPHRDRAQPEAAAGMAVLPGRDPTGSKSCPGIQADIAAAAGSASWRQQRWHRALCCQQRGKAVRRPVLENTSNTGHGRLRNTKDAGHRWRRHLAWREEHFVLDPGLAAVLTILRSHSELLSTRGSPCPGYGVLGSSASSRQQCPCWQQRFRQCSWCLGRHPTHLEDNTAHRRTARHVACGRGEPSA